MGIAARHWPGNTGDLTEHISIGVLTKTVSRSAVDEVLAETGRRERRRRSLPAHVVVYFVLALALFRDGYEEVLAKLVHGLRYVRVWSRQWSVPTTGALSQARQRLGVEPLRRLYEAIAAPLAGPATPGAWLGDWRVMAIDGVMLDLPDTDANRAEFPKPEGGTRRPFPQLRSVGLAECGTHAVVAAQIGSIHTGERALATGLLDAVEPGMLVLADRGFYSFAMWRDWLVTGAQLLWRVWSTVKLDPVRVLADGSYLAEITSKQARSSKARIPLETIGDPKLATHITVRVVEYQISGHTDTGEQTETFRLITTILDPDQASALELAAAYHQRGSWRPPSARSRCSCWLTTGCGPNLPTWSAKSSGAC